MASSIQKALVVGGTNGIGYAIACRLAAEATSSQVIISGRNKPQNIPHSNIEFRSLDASSMRAIKQYADEYKSAASATGPKLDMLVLTQGILSMAGRTETPEGIDRKMALHYYGRQLLIRELMPALKDDAKVLIVLDAKRGSPDKLIWEDLDLKTNFGLAKAADHCISMNDAMIQQFAAEQQQTTNKRHFIHAYPGVVATSIASTLPWFTRPAAKILFKVIAVSPAECAEYLVNGTYEAAAAGEKQNTFWSCIDDKGHLINAKKAIWTEEQRTKVAEHTWKTVDAALNVVD